MIAITNMLIKISHKPLQNDSGLNHAKRFLIKNRGDVFRFNNGVHSISYLDKN